MTHLVCPRCEAVLLRGEIEGMGHRCHWEFRNSISARVMSLGVMRTGTTDEFWVRRDDVLRLVEDAES